MNRLMNNYSTVTPWSHMTKADFVAAKKAYTDHWCDALNRSSDRRVLSALVFHTAYDDGRCFPSRETLAKANKFHKEPMHIKTVQRSIQHLEELGIIEVNRLTDRTAVSGTIGVPGLRGRSNYYTVNLQVEALGTIEGMMTVDSERFIPPIGHYVPTLLDVPAAPVMLPIDSPHAPLVLPTCPPKVLTGQKVTKAVKVMTTDQDQEQGLASLSSVRSEPVKVKGPATSHAVWSKSNGYQLADKFQQLFPKSRVNKEEFTNVLNAWLDEGLTVREITAMMERYQQEQRQETDPAKKGRTPWRHFVACRAHFVDVNKKRAGRGAERDEYTSRGDLKTQTQNAMDRIRKGDFKFGPRVNA